MDVQVWWLLWLDGFCGMDFGVAVKLKWLILIMHFSIADAVRLNFAKLRNPNKHYIWSKCWTFKQLCLMAFILS
ncbi:hypothetical protein T4D_8965 [Trichinella pseudospiralis]|uniref:Uncharacterized protein n=1 Tax=Trichinella pseudospiralis TaxID=6337 RepID=A0A0V1FHY3_TRIPS|nr:hypothetical protein T4D_8965 [Trichinella pseudospiralis]